MRYHQEKAAIVRSLEKQYKNLMDEKQLMKLARYFGYTVGLLGNAVVPPYTYQFGQRVSNFFFADDRISLKVFVSIYFALVSTITFGSLGINVCGEIFPETLQLFYDNPFKEIKVRKRKQKMMMALVLSITILLSIISKIPGTYLTDLVYREYSPFLAVIFDCANQIAWSTVSAWSFYVLPEQIYKEFRNDLYLESQDSPNIRSDLFKKLDHLLKEISFATEYELNQFQMEFFPEDKFTSSSLIKLIQYKSNFPVSRNLSNRLRNLIALLGMIAGTVSIYFYYPVGKASGQMFAQWFNMEESSLYFETFMGVTTYSSEAALAMMSTKYVFELVYDRVGNLSLPSPRKRGQIALQESLIYQSESPSQPASNWSKIKTVLYMMVILIFALTASSYQAEITAEYAPNSVAGLFLIVISSIGATCLGSWSLERLAGKFSKAMNVSAQSKLTQRIGLLRSTLDKMDDTHFQALVSTAEIDEAHETILNFDSHIILS